MYTIIVKNPKNVNDLNEGEVFTAEGLDECIDKIEGRFKEKKEGVDFEIILTKEKYYKFNYQDFISEGGINIDGIGYCKGENTLGPEYDDVAEIDKTPDYSITKEEMLKLTSVIKDKQK